MVPSILLALTVFIVMIDVLVGIHRGFGFGLVRLIVWIAGTVVSVIISRSVTVWILLKIAKVPNMKQLVFETGGWLGEQKSTIGTHLTGLGVSFLVPVVFVGLFIISKVVTWFIYLFIKYLIKKSAKKATAHNAAVEAVKAVQDDQMPDSESVNMDAAFESPVRSTVENGDEEFGTFGIFPKTPEVTQTSDFEQDSQPIAAAYEASPESGFESIAVEEEKDSDVLEQAGFENVSDAQDGFESIARAAIIGEDNSQNHIEEPVKKKKERSARIRPEKERKLKKRYSLSLLIMQESVWQKVLGGVLGLFMGLAACSIIASPVTELAQVISEQKAAEPMVDIVIALTRPNASELIKQAFEETGTQIIDMPADFELLKDFSLRKRDFVEAIVTMDESIVHYVYKYSGAGLVSSFIYNRLVSVSPEKIGLENKGIDSYDISGTLEAYSGVFADLAELINTINTGEGLSERLVDDLEDTMLTIYDVKGPGAVLTDRDKLDLTNGMVDRLNEKISGALELDEDEQMLDKFDSYEEARNGLKDLIDIVKNLISNDVI